MKTLNHKRFIKILNRFNRPTIDFLSCSLFLLSLSSIYSREVVLSVLAMPKR